MFESVFNDSIIKRAQNKEIIKINTYNFRDWATDKHKTVDDKPFGGGKGMVLKVDVIDQALHDIKIRNSNIETRNKSQISNYKKSKLVSDFGFRASDFQNELPHIVLLTPQGKKYDQNIARRLSKKQKLILVCGHYEGFDERVRQLVDEEISIGNYILTGGEIPAMVLVDSISRLIPGVLGKDESSQEESFSMGEEFGKFEYPQYTRPASYKPISKNNKGKLSVPKMLLSGNHAEIRNWRIKQSIDKSKLKR